MFDLKFFNRVVRQTAEAARASLAKSRPLTHFGIGQAKVERVAVNRRVKLPDGKVVNRSKPSDSGGDDPEGLIDPWLKTLSFYNGEQPLAALHYYAVHPISYYGEGTVSSEFVGLARQKRQEDDPKVFQVYFTGCAGNLNACKDTDWKHDKRPLLRDRVYEAMKAAWQATHRQPLTSWGWRTEPILFPPRREKASGAEASRKILLLGGGRAAAFIAPAGDRKVASGGELSRTMLALKTVLAGHDHRGTLVFDEIDANVGGRLGDILGQKLAALGQTHQAICVTHLPQMASYARHHWTIGKSRRGKRTVTQIQLLEEPARLEELASMLRGESRGETTRQEAAAMLEAARRCWLPPRLEGG